MSVARRIVLVTLGLTASPALADHHGMAMHDGGAGSSLATGVSLLAASFGTSFYEGDYEAVVPGAAWSSEHWAAGANLAMYRLQENGRELYGLGDVAVHGQGTLIDAGNIVLSAHGLQGVEYNCEFVQISKATRSPSWAVTAICQEPGYVFPDVLSVTRMSPTQFDLVSVRPIDDESEASGNSGSYYRCEGMVLP